MLPMLDIWRPQTWRNAVGHVLRSILPAKSFPELRRTPADEMFSDTLAYLIPSIPRCFDKDEFVEQLSAQILSFFKTIRGFHGCRPTRGMESYLTEGIIPLNRDLLVRSCMDLVGKQVDPRVVRKAVFEADLNGRLGRVYFGTDIAGSLENYGHYAIYGAESLSCVDDTSWPVSLWELQKKIGISTVIECAVPLTALSKVCRHEITKMIVTMWFQYQSDRPRSEKPARDDCFFAESIVTPDCILGHFHPNRIPDPHQNMKEFQNASTWCSWCLQ